MKKILVCDDERRSLERWTKQLRAVIKRTEVDFTVDSISQKQEFLYAISGLERRRKAARRRSRNAQDWGQNQFDSVDILVVDYDLLNLEEGVSSYVTGETVAYLCRCYSQCGLIIALNQYGTNYFDLTLKGHPESFADLNLGSDQLANSGLWAGEWTGFRPWYWPVLSRACVSFEERCRKLVDHLDDGVLSYLDFPDDVVKVLPRSTKEFLGRGRNPEETTFREFATRSGNGLRRKDKAFDDQSVARIAAARLGKWLERLVLPGQDILVDAPHLVSRYPSLLTGNPNRIASWNRSTSLTANAIGLREARIESARFTKAQWLSRPAWFWKAITGMENIEEVSKPWSKEQSQFVFCEDVSRFLPVAAAREFVADLPSNFVRRFVVNPSSPKAGKYAGETRGVDYRPSVRLSL